MTSDIEAYNRAQTPEMRRICEVLADEIGSGLPEASSKVWHGGPVWFLAGNPVAGYWVRKKGVQLLFWSGQSFRVDGLRPEGKFKAAEAHYLRAEEIAPDKLRRWLAEARIVQWDYKNIVKRRGVLDKIGNW